MSGGKLTEVTSKWKEQMAMTRLDRMDRENDKLRMELDSVRSMLDRERDERDELLGTIKKRPEVVVKKKKGGFLRLLIVGAGAYIVGARAGRERYEQITDWAQKAKSKAKDSAGDMRDAGAAVKDAAVDVKDAAVQKQTEIKSKNIPNVA
jgi:hypothetical protein